MKRVFQNHSELAHAWASQHQSEGRANNMFFENRIIYSYGYHYKLGMIHRSTVLINSSGYSNSTAKHSMHARRAISHRAIIDCPRVDPRSPADHDENIAYFTSKIETYQKKTVRARTNAEWYMNYAESVARDYNNYKDLFGLDKLPYIEPSELFTDEARQKASDNVQAESKKAREREAKRQKKLAIELDQWEQGHASHYNLNNAPVRLRIGDNVIETSHGAKVQIDHAIILLRMIKQGRELKGFQIGDFRVSGIENDCLVIDCHQIPLAQVKKIEQLISNK